MYVPVTGGNWAANCYLCAPGTVVDISGYAAGTDLDSYWGPDENFVLVNGN